MNIDLYMAVPVKVLHYFQKMTPWHTYEFYTGIVADFKHYAVEICSLVAAVQVIIGIAGVRDNLAIASHLYLPWRTLLPILVCADNRQSLQ